MAGLGGGNGGGASQVRAGRAFVEMTLKGGDTVTKALEKLRARFQSFGGLLAKTGGLTGGLGASVAAAFKPAVDALDELGQIGAAAAGFNLSAEAASRLFGIMKASGSDIRDATEGLATFNTRIQEALEGKGEVAADLFKKLGVGAEEFAALPVDQRFYKLLEVIRSLGPEADKVRILMDAIGEDTGKNNLSTLALTNEEMRALGDAYQMTAEDIKEATKATMAQKVAGAVMGKIWREIGVAVAPVVKQLADQFLALAKPVATFIQNNREGFATGLKIALAATVIGGALVGLGAILGAVAAGVSGFLTALGMVGTVIAAVLSPVGLTVAAFAALGAGLAYLIAQTEAGAGFFEWINNGFRGVAEVATEAWGGIAAALGKGDLKAAFEIAMLGLEVVWQDLMLTLTTAWVGFKMTFVDGWHMVVAGAKIAWAEFSGFMTSTFAKAVGKVLEIGGKLAGLLGANELKDALDLYSAAALDVGAAASAEAEKKAVKTAEELVKKLRENKDARIGDILAAEAKLTEAKAKLTEAVAKAKAKPVGPGIIGNLFGAAIEKALAGGRVAAERTASIVGSRGTFSGMMANQRFGVETIDAKQLKVAQENLVVLKAVKQAAEGIAKGLVLK